MNIAIFSRFLILNHHRILRGIFTLLQNTRKANIKYPRTNHKIIISFVKTSWHSMCEIIRKHKSSTKYHSCVFVARKRNERSRFRSSSIFFPLFYTLKRTQRGLRKYGMQIFDRSAQRCGNGVCRGTGDDIKEGKREWKEVKEDAS